MKSLASSFLYLACLFHTNISQAAVASRHPWQDQLSGCKGVVGLTIGMDAYSGGIRPLENAGNDASAIADLFRSRGAEIDAALDANRRDFDDKFNNMVSKIPGKCLAFMYIGGIGVALPDGSPVVITTSTSDATETSARSEGIMLQGIIRKLEDVSLAAVFVIIDADFLPSFGGITEPVLPARPNIVIAYAAAPDGVVLDGSRNAHSPVAAVLLEELQRGDTSLNNISSLITRKVATQTRGKQCPWIATTLIRDFNLVTGSVDDAEPARKK